LDVEALAAEYETRPAEDVLRWALESFGSMVAISTSFQAEGNVILDMAHRIDPEVKVFTIDTGRLPQETYELIDRVRDRYGIQVQVYSPDRDELAQMVGKHGMNPFYRSVSLRLLCCNIRKVEPLDRALKDLDAWISGLRRSQVETRAGAAKIERDTARGRVIKVNPLADWSYERVWEYIKANQVPYNELYDKGYTSIGCAPCTRAIRPGEDTRAGRWWWEKGMPKECGIHMGPAWGRTT
jgi:thioredoxin-dependent adenylylsulfate APS reductase